jgi:hypothetical protein
VVFCNNEDCEKNFIVQKAFDSLKMLLTMWMHDGLIIENTGDFSALKIHTTHSLNQWCLTFGDINF